MPSYKRPGVYVEEVLTPTSVVVGDNVSAAGFIGGFRRGPTTPILIDSWSKFLSWFGGFGSATEYLPYAIYSFFANGGRQAYCCRVAGTGAATATRMLIDRSTPTNEVQTIATATGTPASGTFTLTFSGQTTATIAYDADAAAVQTALVALSNVGTGDMTCGGGPLPGTAVTCTFTGTLAGTNQPAMTVASQPTGGTYGVTETTQGAPAPNTLKVDASNHGAWGNALYLDVQNAGPSSGLPSGTPDRFNLIVKSGGTGDANVVERWLDLSMTSTDARYAPNIINHPTAGSTYIVVTDQSSASTAPSNQPLAATGLVLGGGLDGTQPVTDSQVAGAVAGAFDTVLDPFNLNLPGVYDTAQIGTVLTYASGRGDVFVVIDPQAGQTVADVTGSSFVGSLSTSSYGAVFYPWLYVSDPAGSSAAVKRIPPGGAVLGQFAATDTTRGVWKAPAGLGNRIAGAVGLEAKLTNADLDNLNDSNVNAIRQIPGSGVVLMGARTLKLSGLDRYISVRRTLIYLRSALVTSTRWAVFEPNDTVLWASLQASIQKFLTEFWAQGGLRGATPDEAYYVTCDESNNPPSSVAAGQVNIEVGVALQSPTEFVVIKIGQWDGGASATVSV